MSTTPASERARRIVTVPAGPSKEEASQMSDEALSELISQYEAIIDGLGELVGPLKRLRRARVAAAASAQARAERTLEEARLIAMSREQDPRIRGSVVRLSEEFGRPRRTINNRLRQAKGAKGA
jgi:hypothetical protein